MQQGTFGASGGASGLSILSTLAIGFYLFFFITAIMGCFRGYYGNKFNFNWFLCAVFIEFFIAINSSLIGGLIMLGSLIAAIVVLASKFKFQKWNSFLFFYFAGSGAILLGNGFEISNKGIQLGNIVLMIIAGIVGIILGAFSPKFNKKVKIVVSAVCYGYLSARYELLHFNTMVMIIAFVGFGMLVQFTANRGSEQNDTGSYEEPFKDFNINNLNPSAIKVKFKTIKNMGAKKCIGIILCAVGFIICLLPLIYNPNLSEELSISMNGNLFMVFKFVNYACAIAEMDSDFGMFLILLMLAGCVGVLLLAIFAVKYCISSIGWIDNNYDQSLRDVYKAFNCFIAIGIISLTLGFAFNININLAINTKLTSQSSHNYNMTAEERESYNSAIKEAKELAHEKVDQYKYKISIPTVLLILLGIVSPKVVRKVTYPYTRAGGGNPTAVNTATKLNSDSWKCNYCGTINKSDSKFCVNCGKENSVKQNE